MHYHIILTERCNLKCKYCYEKSMQEFDNGLDEKFDYDMRTPVDTEVNVEKLKKFLKKDDTLIFYGGEPLVKIDKIMEIMDNVNCRFAIQTNGIFLDKLPKEYLMKIGKMLISIDGDKIRTNENRGKGVYELVLRNLKKIRNENYKGEIVARMTIEKPDIEEQVKHILSLKIFDSVHWQIDAGFYKFDFDKENFSQFVRDYNNSLTKLLNFWVDEIKKGNVLKIYPFLGVFDRVVGFDEDKVIPCGSGSKNFTINTKGDLSACPIMNSVKNFYCGDIEKGVTKEFHVEECSNCGYLNICGGRCLYWHGAKLWPGVGDKLICDTIKHLINSIQEKKDEILDLIGKGIVKKEDFIYEKYFGPEIIP